MNALKLAAALLALFTLTISSPAAPAYPVKKSANSRYLVDQNNIPFLIVGDSPQALIVNLTEAEASAFFADRAALGFNTMWINLLCATYTGGRTNASTIDGILPFSTNIVASSSYDLTKTNEAYFARVDHMLNLAAQNGIQVLLDPAETGSFLSVMLANGTNKCRAYGQFLGDRYKNFTNIIWMSGNDFQSWRNAGDDAVVRAVALGIKDKDPNHIHTTELDFNVSSSLDDANWNSIIDLNATYTYYATYARLLQDYNRPNFLPNFMVEANYEFEHAYTGNSTLRHQEYWTMLSGATGQLYGNGYTWPFVSGWQSHLDTPGAIQFGYVTALFAPRAWFNLVPDTNHVVVTAGFGTFDTNADIHLVNNNDYATAARTADGSLVMAYMPTARTLTVDMSKLSGPAVAHWYDPANSTYLSISGSPFANSGARDFTPSGNNSDSDGDWILVLETNPPPIVIPPAKPAFIQQAYSVPQTPQLVVSVAYTQSQTAGNANLLAIGWNDAVATITNVSDSASNIYQIAVPTFRGNGMSQAIYYCPNIKSGANTVTAKFSQPAVFVDLRITEYSGLSQTNTFDTGTSGTGNGTTASSGLITIGSSNELLFAAGMTATTFGAPGPGFTQRVITSPDGDIIEDQIANTAGSFNATATLSSGAWLMQLAAFKSEAPITAPSLRIFRTGTNTFILAWPTNSVTFFLQQTRTLLPAAWTASTNPVTIVGAENQATISPSTSQQYFRLKYP
jgi:Protein of unknown function (DUF4038)/Putative collagen-binding domain of a collagenase